MKPPPKLSGENYMTWAFSFEQWMQWKELWNILTSDPPPDDETDDIKSSWRRKNAQGFSTLTLSFEDDEVQAIKEFKDNICSSKLA